MSEHKIFISDFYRKRNVFIKAIIFTILVISMICYVIYIMYLSEPKFYNDMYGKPNQFDYVTAYHKQGYNEGFLEGVVLQRDSVGFTMRHSSPFSMGYRELESGLYTLPYQSNYKIIGKGTIYHKVNSYVGFNIMLISVIFIAIIAIVLSTSLVRMVNEFLF